MAKKLILDCSEELWEKVLMYKIKQKCKNNNEAVAQLIEKGLKK